MSLSRPHEREKIKRSKKKIQWDRRREDNGREERGKRRELDEVRGNWKQRKGEQEKEGKGQEGSQGLKGK